MGLRYSQSLWETFVRTLNLVIKNTLVLGMITRPERRRVHIVGKFLGYPSAELW